MILKCFFKVLILLVLGESYLFAQTKGSDVSEEGKIIKVAAAQILSSWNIAENEKKITNAVIEAANQGCEVILFHEGCLTNYPVGDDIKRIDFKKVRAAERRILSISKEHHIAILLGTSSEEDGRYHNHVVIANENGKILGRYSKTWRAGDKPYEAGSGPVIFTVAGVEATVIICHDLRYPELARLGVAAGAQIVFIANNESGLTYENKLLGYRSMQIARATESMVYSVMANAPADPKDIERYNCSHGNSKIVDPLGNIVDEAGSFEERLVIGELDLNRAHRSTVLRTIGENEKINEYYDVKCENIPYRNWMRDGVKMVVRLDGNDIPAYLKENRSNSVAFTGGSPDSLAIASISFIPEKWAKEVNAERIEALTRKAVSQGAELVITPEGALEGYVVNDVINEEDAEKKEVLTKRFTELAEPADGEYITRLYRLADELDIYLIIGYLAKEGPNIYNAAMLIGPDGKRIGHYYKSHFWQGYDVNPPGYTPGSAFPVFQLGEMNLGIMICADRQFPEVARMLALNGSDLIVCPAYGNYGDRNTAMMRTRAVENQVCLVFTHPHHSLIIGNDGTVIGECNSDEIVIKYIPWKSVEKTRPSVSYRRPELYH